MRTLYIDCQYGIAGDMLLASLIDLGANLPYIVSELRKLPIDEFELGVATKNEEGIQGKQLALTFPKEQLLTDFSKLSSNSQAASLVAAKHDHSHHHNHDENDHHHHDHDENDHHHHHDENDHHHHRKGADILKMIGESQLPEPVKVRSMALFSEIARAEAKIHGLPVTEVHFHEVGAMDSIIDIIGVCLALESLEVREVISAEVPTGFGRLKMAHGLYPIPAPATAEILTGVPLSGYSAEGEMTTPTGAAFVKVFPTSYGPVPRGEIVNIGYGIGSKKFPHPNVLRTMLIKKKVLK